MPVDSRRTHEITLRVRYGETDKMGVIYHANYFLFFENGRTEFLRRLGVSYRDLEARGVALVVVDCGARFRGNAGYDDLLTVRTWVDALSRARVTFRYEVLRDGRLLVEGFTTLGCLDARGKPNGIPEDVAGLLAGAGDAAGAGGETPDG